MRITRIAGQSFESLVKHKLRTFFMMAGTIVGIAALVIIMAMGRGTEKRVMTRVNNFGPRAIMLIAGGGKDLPPPDLSVTTLTLDDAKAIREEVPGLEIVTPQAWRFNVPLRFEANEVSSVVWGVEPVWHDAWEWYPIHGEGITEEDVATQSRVCVIGASVAKDLFGWEPAMEGGTNPIGKTILAGKGSVPLEVKGVLKRRGVPGPGMSDFDMRIVIPITTAMRRVMNVDHIGGIRMVSGDAERIPEQVRQMRELIHQRHRIVPPQEDDFRIITPTVIAGIARGTSRTLNALLIALAALSLLVGGVVLMNILLISVAERTKEIGLRRAVGATRRDIFMQFLVESLSVSFLGMVLGCMLGWGISVALASLRVMPMLVTWEPFAVSAAFALAVGTLFGVQPARRAAKLDPVEALR